MKFAKIVFVVAGIYGLITLIPAYFLEIYVGIVDPPPITHPEYFYGFLGVAIAWQVAFLVIASDPKRYRPLMLVALLEKVGYGAAVVVLFEAHRVEVSVMAPGLVDLLLGALFLTAYLKLAKAPQPVPVEPHWIRANG